MTQTTLSAQGQAAQRRATRAWTNFGTIFTEPFRAHPEWLTTLTVAQQEQIRRQVLLRLTIIATNVLVLGVALPALIVNHSPLIVTITTGASAILGIPCIILNTRGQTTLAALLFLGIFYIGLVPNIILRDPTGYSITSLASFCYFALLLIIAGLILPVRLLLVTAGIIILTTIVALAAVPIDPSLLNGAFSAKSLRFAMGGIFVTLELFVTALSWIVARIATANIQGAQVAMQRERELLDLKDQFIVNANHELRTPIMALYGNLEFLATLGDRAPAEQRATLLSRALGAGDTLLGLLGTIFDASIMEGEHVIVTPRPVTLAPLVRGLLMTFDPREIGEPTLAGDQSLARDVSVTIPDDLVVLADEKRLRQVLLNLVTNALKYSAPGTPIAVHAEVAGSFARISVSDRGLGVPPDQAGMLFARFVRLPRDIAGTVRGTGLGLYLCRLFVQAMGGTIGMESSGIPGEGSTFTFTLPLPPS